MTAKLSYEELERQVQELEKIKSELKYSREMLRESENSFKQLYEIAPLGYQSLDENGHFIVVNQTWLDTLGYAKEEVIGKSFSDFLHPDWRNHFKDNFPRFKSVGEILGVEFEMVKKNGNLILVSFTGKISRDKIGNFQQTHCIFYDITERKLAEFECKSTVRILEILNAETVLRKMMHSLLYFMQEITGCEALGIRLRKGDDFPYYEVSGFSDDFVASETHLCMEDLSGQLERDDIGNPVLECMCGNVIRGRFDSSKPFFTEFGSFVTNSTTRLLAGTSEQDRQTRTRNRCNGEGYESVLLIPLRTGGKTFGLLQFNDRQEGRFPQQIVNHLERIAGNVALALAQRELEKALKESEERLGLAMAVKNEGIWDWNLVTNETLFDERYYTMAGYTNNEFPQNLKAWAERVHPEDLPNAEAAIQAYLSGQSDLYDIEFRFRHKEGYWMWIQGRSKIVKRDESGVPMRMIGTHTDITERVRAEKIIKSSLKEKETLLKEVHHRVKNNMQVISSLLNLQIPRSKDENAKRALMDCKGRINSMASVHEMLYMSENLSLIDCQSYISKLASDIFQSYYPVSRGVKLTVEANGLILGIQQASPLGLIINELLSNSLKYGLPEKGPGQIIIRLKVQKPNIVEFVFSDNGISIPKDFDWRNTQSLGLNLVVLLAENQLDGTIKLDREKGTCFTITFSLENNQAEGI